MSGTGEGRKVHLVGSTPFAAAAHLGPHLKRLPDGEVGERDSWIKRQHARIGRSPQFRIVEVDPVYVQVPTEHHDDVYFAPVADLRLKSGCELFLGLVHMTGGIVGTRRRIAAAEKVVRNFGIATECGFGRLPADTIPDLFRRHAEVAGV